MNLMKMEWWRQETQSTLSSKQEESYATPFSEHFFHSHFSVSKKKKLRITGSLISLKIRQKLMHNKYAADGKS